MIKKRIPRDLIFDPYPKRKPAVFRRFLVLLLVGLSTAIAALHVKAEGDPENAPVVDAGALTAVSNNGLRADVLHLNTHADIKINGLLVDVTYHQRFKNRSDEWVNGVYTFPLPENAAVNDMTIRIGERIIKGEIKERADARKIFEKAVKEGRRAALTEQQRPNLFTQRIGNIPPGEEIEVTLRFLDIARFQRDHFSWRLPTTLTPRFVPGTPLQLADPPVEVVNSQLSGFAGWALATDEVDDAPLITPPIATASSGHSNPLSLTVSLQAGLELARIDALYHQLDIRKEDQGHHIYLKEGQSEMDRDFVLQWSPVASASPTAALFQQQLGNEKYAMLMVMPPQHPQPQALPRDIIFIIDTSGSMQGQSIVQAKASLQLAVSKLTLNDRFNVIAFNDRPLSMFASPQIADEATTRMAKGWIAALQAEGGTQMAPALSAAFMQSDEPERLQQVVFITDGAVGNESALFSQIKAQAKQKRLFTVGIGSAPNSYFMTKAAEYGRGAFEYIGDVSEVNQRMNRLFDRLNGSVAKNISIGWPQDAEVFPANVPDLYRDEPVLSFARLSNMPNAVSVSGETASQEWRRSVSSEHVTNTNGIGAHWARKKIAHIEDLGRNGELSEDNVKTQIIDVALTHRLLSRFTAFVAVDTQIARNDSALRPPLRAVVPNMLAQGQQLAYPRTATRAQLMLWIGALCLLAGLGILLVQRRHRHD